MLIPFTVNEASHIKSPGASPKVYQGVDHRDETILNSSGKVENMVTRRTCCRLDIHVLFDSRSEFS